MAFFSFFGSREPFSEFESDNKEDIKIEQILDNSGNEINLQNIRINIQSLGTSECYWLDSGIFDF